KFLDSAALLLLVVGLLPWIHLPPWLRQGAGILGLVSAALMVLLILASYGGEKLRYGMDRLAGWVPWAERLELVRWLDGLLRGLKLLGKPNVLGRALIWSGLIWALAAVTNYLVMEALRIEAPPVAAVLLLAALHLSVILPTTPTQLGVFHYVCVLSLSLFGVPREPALGYGFALHLVVYVPMISLGALCLWREGIDLRRSERAR
ncbi:MAG: lysylphosphatidylglycerol synthase transmembrane domain-containing protein, partial [Anaerolineae bacterium]